MSKFTKLQDKMHFITSQDSFIRDHKDVNQYFGSCTEKIFVARQYYSPKRYEFIKFQEYLDKRFKDSCYYYSSYAIMGLLGTDNVVRGKIDLEELDELARLMLEPNKNFMLLDKIWNNKSKFRIMTGGTIN